ncbi:MAG: hypothetical protein Q9200_003615 [Gallowayella weberi]
MPYNVRPTALYAEAEGNAAYNPFMHKVKQAALYAEAEGNAAYDPFMHKVKQAALYVEAEGNVAYNPFGKIRKASVYAEPEGDETQKPVITELVRRGTRNSTFVDQANSPIIGTESSLERKPTIGLRLPARGDEEKTFHLCDSQTAETIESRKITRKQRAFLIWRQWRRRLARLGFGDQWEVRPAIADIATATIAFAPLGTSGHYLLPATARPRQTVVIEYEDQKQRIPSRERSNKLRLPRVRTFSPRDEKDERRGNAFSGLIDLTDEASYFASSTSLRVIYVQDDINTSKQLISDFHIDSPAFSRNRTKFCDWVFGEDIEHLSVWQTAFWRPSYDRSRNVVRAAFGLEYLVPQLHSVSLVESHARFSKVPRLKPWVESPQDVHDNSLQRLSVYVQLPRAQSTSPSTLGAPTGIDQFAQGDMPIHGISRVQKARLACESTVIVLDSHRKAIATAPLIAGEEPWQQLLDFLDDPPQDQSSYRLALAVVELTFESVAARWSHYILSMHNYIASVEERVYENPADDTRTNALWSVSKQLLQAERLLKFHILLLENIQNDFRGLEEEEDDSPTDWLQPNLSEFRRLSSEVEETLKKPTAHMVDLVLHRCSAFGKFGLFGVNGAGLTLADVYSPAFLACGKDMDA